MFEGTGKYFFLLFLVFFIVLITVKICEYYIFKSAKLEGWKAFIPFYNRMLLIDKLDLKRSIFYKTLIPFANLYYYYIIIEKLLDAYQLDTQDAVWFVVIPMYKFPELVFKHPRFMLHMYDETEKFMQNENILFKVEEPVTQPEPIQNVETEVQNQTNQSTPQETYPDTVFSNEELRPNERHETIVEAKQQTAEEKAPITQNTERPTVCPNCGTKLPPNAGVCFFCGTKIS